MFANSGILGTVVPAWLLGVPQQENGFLLSSVISAHPKYRYVSAVVEFRGQLGQYRIN